MSFVNRAAIRRFPGVRGGQKWSGYVFYTATLNDILFPRFLCACSMRVYLCIHHVCFVSAGTSFSNYRMHFFMRSGGQSVELMETGFARREQKLERALIVSPHACCLNCYDNGSLALI